MAKTVTRKITLFLEGEDKTFYSKFANARNIIKAQNLFKKMEDAEDEMAVLDEVLDFLAKDIYHGEFTKDDMWDGIDAADFMEELQNQLMLVMTRDVESLKKQAFLANQK